MRKITSDLNETVNLLQRSFSATTISSKFGDFAETAIFEFLLKMLTSEFD